MLAIAIAVAMSLAGHVEPRFTTPALPPVQISPDPVAPAPATPEK